MTKILAEDCKKLSIYNLHRWKYLIQSNCAAGNFYWTSSWKENQDKMGFLLDLRDPNNMYMDLDYTIRNGGDDEWRPIKNRYPIVSTTCNYGGKRYWFKCSIYTNGWYCGRRVATLYLGGGSDYMACRHCYNLTYNSRNQGYSFVNPDVEEYGRKIKKWYYQGKLTRKHRRYLKMESAVNNTMMRFLTYLDKRK